MCEAYTFKEGKATKFLNSWTDPLWTPYAPLMPLMCACSGCMVQIQGGLDKQLPGVRMKHVADILAERIKG